jgi:hypothetical protein
MAYKTVQRRTSETLQEIYDISVGYHNSGVPLGVLASAAKVSPKALAKKFNAKYGKNIDLEGLTTITQPSLEKALKDWAYGLLCGEGDLEPETIVEQRDLVLAAIEALQGVE